MSVRVEKHPDLVALGQAVRRLRRAADLTQEDLAARAGISANYVGEIERGEFNPSVLVMFALAEGLGIDPAGLFRSDSS
jgi:transcriptional regulator with XRE-family HTH domain